MKTKEKFQQELEKVFGSDVRGTVVEQDGILTAKMTVEGEITDEQTGKLSFVGRFKFKRSGTGITFTVTSKTTAMTAEEMEMALNN